MPFGLVIFLGIAAFADEPPGKVPAAPPAALATPSATRPGTAAAPTMPTVTAPAASFPLASSPAAVLPPIPTTPDAEAPKPQPTSSAPATIAKPRGRLQIGDILQPALWLIGALVCAAIAFAFLKRLRKHEELSDEANAHSQLATFRELREKGEMTEEEYKKVMLKLQDKIKGMPTGTKAAPPPSPNNGAPGPKK